jgi:hypothetical protein
MDRCRARALDQARLDFKLRHSNYLYLTTCLLQTQGLSAGLHPETYRGSPQARPHVPHHKRTGAYHEKNAKHRNGNWVSHLNDFYGYTIHARWYQRLGRPGTSGDGGGVLVLGSGRRIRHCGHSYRVGRECGCLRPHCFGHHRRSQNHQCCRSQNFKLRHYPTSRIPLPRSSTGFPQLIHRLVTRL